MDFNEAYYTSEIQGVTDYPHFLQRAQWIKDYISEGAKVYIIGCGFGHTVKHLQELGVNAYGVELPYACSQSVTDAMFEIDIKDADLSDADYIFSWNVLDTLSDESAGAVIDNLKLFTCPQIHVICASGNYDGYFIKSVEWWCSFLPNATIVDYTSRQGLEGIPLSWGLVAE